MKVQVTQVFDLKLLLTYCLIHTKILFKKLKKFTYRNKTVHFPLLFRWVQALSRPGLTGDREQRIGTTGIGQPCLSLWTHIYSMGISSKVWGCTGIGNCNHQFHWLEIAWIPQLLPYQLSYRLKLVSLVNICLFPVLQHRHPEDG